MLEKMGEFKQQRVIEDFEAATKDAERVQRETLTKILEENGESEYLQGLGLGGRTDTESFKSCVPLVTHKDLEVYIQRIADGEGSPILTGKPIETISLRCWILGVFFFLISICCCLCWFWEICNEISLLLQLWDYSREAQVLAFQ